MWKISEKNKFLINSETQKQVQTIKTLICCVLENSIFKTVFVLWLCSYHVSKVLILRMYPINYSEIHIFFSFIFVFLLATWNLLLWGITLPPPIVKILSMFLYLNGFFSQIKDTYKLAIYQICCESYFLRNQHFYMTHHT